MPRVTIDNREVEVPDGSTLLDAAAQLGIDIPTLCYLKGYAPNTTCMVCVVKREDTGRFVPACATRVEDGMRVSSATDEVRAARRTALELLLSDHVGDCRAPCQYACPFNTDIPHMLRQLGAGCFAEAGATLRAAMPLAAVLTRVTREVSEGACRRRGLDAAVAIGLLKRFAAEQSLTAGVVPDLSGEKTGKRVAIVGGGPVGLSAAYFLARRGHDCTVFEQRENAGGRLREEVGEQLPPEVLAAEIDLIERLGVRFELSQVIDRLPADFDAVLIATGWQGAGSGELLGLLLEDGRLPVDSKTHATSSAGVFAAGDVVREHKQVLTAAVDGKAAADCIDQYLRGEEVSGPPKLKSLRISPPRGEELVDMLTRVNAAPRVEPAAGIAGGLTEEEAGAEARRCLHCDCRSLERCKLRRYAEEYGADGARYRGVRREARCVVEHPDILFEPGKCILCGLCIQVAAKAGEPVGLTLNGRGFNTRVTTPFDASLVEALRVAGRQCVEVCPAGALVWCGND